LALEWNNFHASILIHAKLSRFQGVHPIRFPPQDVLI
jgi:hypothetical protein